MRAIEAGLSPVMAAAAGPNCRSRDRQDRVLVRVTASRVTPSIHGPVGWTPSSKAPLCWAMRARCHEDAGDSGLAVGSRVMFTDPTAS